MSSKRRWRRLTMVVSVASLVVAGCSGDGGDGGAAPPEADGNGTRIVQTARGEVEIPAEPRRMVIDWVTFDNLLALDYDLGRVVDVFELTFFLDNPEFSPHLTARAVELGLRGAVGATYEPNFEALAETAPDLVLMAEDQASDDQQVATMEKIAPVVAYELPDGHKSFAQWESGLSSLAEVLGGDAPDRARQLIDDFEADVADLREEHADVIQELEVSIGKISEDSVTLSMEGRNIGTEVSAALGLRRPAEQLALEIDEYKTVAVSPERLPVIDADILFLEQRQENLSFLETNPLFQGLGAVQAGNVHFVANYWEFGGAGAARRVLADVADAITAWKASAAA